MDFQIRVNTVPCGAISHVHKQLQLIHRALAHWAVETTSIRIAEWVNKQSNPTGPSKGHDLSTLLSIRDAAHPEVHRVLSTLCNNASNKAFQLTKFLAPTGRLFYQKNRQAPNQDDSVHRNEYIVRLIYEVEDKLSLHKGVDACLVHAALEGEP